jgi:hypothetical protein
MRVIITAAAVAAVTFVALGSSPAQAQASQYGRCVELAVRQGLSARSASGRRFVARCMQRRTYAPPPTYYGPPTYGSSPNCPDDPRARSAYPAWMCR